MSFKDDVFEHGPDPDHPGWRHWNLKDDTLFNGAVMGKLITRVDADGKARLRPGSAAHGLRERQPVVAAAVGPVDHDRLDQQFARSLECPMEVPQRTGRAAFQQRRPARSDQSFG